MYYSTTGNGNRERMYRGIQIVWYLLAIIEAFLFLRLLLRLLGADFTSSFTSFVYSVAGVFTAPFEAIFAQSTPLTVGSIFEWNTLVAMIVYWLIALGIVRLLRMGQQVPTEESRNRPDQK